MDALSVKSRLRYFFCSFIIITHLLIILSAVSCGRRGDPFLSSPHDIAEEENIIFNERGKEEDPSKRNEDVAIGRPDAPSGLVGIFTGKTVVLSWGEVKGQGVKVYIIYRKDHDGYKKAGESVVPAFIDEDIIKKSSYRYKVTAVGKTESDFSIEINIITEDK